MEQAVKENRASLDILGGVDELAKKLRVSFEGGLTSSQVLDHRRRYGTNSFPESPMQSYFSLLFDAFSDSTLLVLMAASAVSLAVGVVENPDKGWLEGTSIFIAVILVANITAGNDYSKELQFRALEASSQQDERTSVYRDFCIERINPKDLVVGDVIILQVITSPEMFANLVCLELTF